MRQLIQSFLRLLKQPAFVIVATILFLSAVGLNGATQFLHLHFKKLPVELSRPLNSFPQQVGPWVQVSIDEPIAHEMQDVLGTDKYVFRDYVDSRLVDAKTIAEFADKTPSQRMLLMQKLQQAMPAAVVNLALTYYTGMVDTVAHIPDRCYIADGFEPTNYAVEPWTAMRGRIGSQNVRYIVFEDEAPNRHAVPRDVGYFFNCNGQYMDDHIAVRKSLASLVEKYGYYMKIEVQTIGLSHDGGAKTLNDFLTSAMPEIEKCLPDWQKTRGH
jgi:hypothetical protein